MSYPGQLLTVCCPGALQVVWSYGEARNKLRPVLLEWDMRQGPEPDGGCALGGRKKCRLSWAEPVPGMGHGAGAPARRWAREWGNGRHGLNLLTCCKGIRWSQRTPSEHACRIHMFESACSGACCSLVKSLRCLLFSYVALQSLPARWWSSARGASRRWRPRTAGTGPTCWSECASRGATRTGRHLLLSSLECVA